MRRRLSRVAQLAVAVLGASTLLINTGAAPAASNGAEFVVGGWQVYEFIQGQPACTGLGYEKQLFKRADCGFGSITLTPATAGKQVKFDFIDSGGTVVDTQNVTTVTGGEAQFDILPDQNWDPGEITVRATVAAPDTGSAQTRFTLNPLEVTVLTGDPSVPGQAVSVTGTVTQLDSTTCCLDTRPPVPANVSATLHAPDGTQLAGPVTTTANSDGEWTADFPASATEGLRAGPETDFELELAVRATAAYDDPTPFVSGDVRDAPTLNRTSGAWAGEGAGPVVVRTPPDALILENSYVSSLGWVKPGDAYPFRVSVRNETTSAASNAQVVIPAPDGVAFTQVKPLGGAGTASIGASGITWSIPSVGTGDTATLVVEAKAETLTQDPRIVWKDLSSTASLTYEGHADSVTAESHGPKVIPPTGGFETARYGDKPFPIVPVDYTDRKHETRHSGDALARKVNSPNVAGSTYNLYQEMSYGQLHPFGSVPSVGIATAGWDYAGGFQFSERDVTKPTCRGVSYSNVNEVRGTPLYPERIRDGWYQLPGDTEYYGGDFPVFTATSALGIDSACGDTSKSVYDAAVIADPEIDYNKFDGDKDGVVDFFMMVFVGEGGNGASQVGGGYDNIWPHSSSLEFGYQDEATGLSGYISDDQLTDHEGVPQCWTDDSYSDYADCQASGGTGRDDLPTYVRVGPYNVNPETAIDQASVIAHEYGHHLGLPDFYSSYSAYGDWNLMATDHSQHMTIFGKQELGWVVPEFLQPGETRSVTDWEEIKNDTGEIKWQTPQGEAYTLSAANGSQNVHNGQSYALKLPRKLVIDPQKVQEQTAGEDTNLWWSGRGNDFGCAPKAGHNLDIALPELQSVPEGTPVTVSFKSSFDIEWDFDYGFVLGTTDGSNYASFPSTKGFTVSKNVNPNNVACLRNFDNGLTGTSGAHAGGPAQVAADRATTSYDSGSPFVEDEYDISSYAGQQGFVLRLSYFTDPGLDRPGWFIDDLVVKAGDQVIYSSDFAQEDELRLFPGGCNDGRKVTKRCTDGWTRIAADQPSELDHGYYLELRDRAGFDFEGRGEADRGPLGWEPGVLVEYTDEIRGYGNNGSSSPPRQHYIDSQPQPDYDCGNAEVQEHPTPDVLTPHRCQDAAFTAATGDNMFRDVGWIDNFWDDSAPDKLWHFDYGCLTLNVGSMAGNTGNSEALPADLTASATITAGSGCSPFEYAAGVVNAAPTAVASADPKTAAAGETVTFSAAGSFDDADSPEALTYAWDFGDGSTGSGASATHAYAAKGTYDATLTVTDSAGLSDTATVTVTVLGPDLQVTNLVAGAGKVKQGQTVTVTATVHNAGPGSTRATKTEFVLDGSTVLGTVDTPALASGASAQVSVSWNAKSTNGTHTLKATADRTSLVAEEVEDNNSATRTVTVQGNKVTNGDFEQQTASGQPEAWSGQSTGSGTASSTSTGGTDGSNGAQLQGNGGNAATSGSPTWTSAPVSVQAGEVYDVTAAVKANGLSSSPSLSLLYLGAAGQVLDTAKVLSAPLQTDGFKALERSVTIPPLVTQVRVVLSGFAPTDLRTRGTVTFDDVGLYTS